ncbi:MAG: hypothetical protein PHP50_08010 [Lachnospiraceae bacterium]|nr:hypothetical protein [Lachnospiraceae bacterium]
MFAFVTGVIQNYKGSGLLLLLYLGALALLFLKEKNWPKRILLVSVPVCILIVFMIPLFQIAFNHFLDPETYYRMLWILPMSVTIAYAGIRLLEGHRRMVLIIMTVMIVLSGKYVYTGDYMAEAENAYHIPQTVVDVCDVILPEDGSQVCAVFPDDLIHYVRQYSSRIIMPYGREMLVHRWDYDDPFYRLMQQENMETGELSVTAKGYNCNYIILSTEKTFQQPMEDYGYEIVATIDGYNIYKDTTVTWPN